MFNKFFKALFMLAGLAVGAGLVALIVQLTEDITGFDIYTAINYYVIIGIYIAASLVFGIIFYILSDKIIATSESISKTLEKDVANSSAGTFAAGALGLLFALVLAFLVTALFNNVDNSGITLGLSIIIYILFGAVGLRLGMKVLTKFRVFSDKKYTTAQESVGGMPKILDTSVIIDGRIFYICETGVIEGRLIIPEFVLAELRHIADSADSLRRTKGRSGMDMLARIQKELDIPVEVTSLDYDDIAEVDAKLLRMAKDMDGKLITNDFNLIKVAKVQNVPILNINELSNAVKPVMMPGEDMKLTIIKEGKEQGQGIGYLEDGTMIVVKDAAHLVGQTVDVCVTSTLQTSAGRMIFANVSETLN